MTELVFAAMVFFCGFFVGLIVSMVRDVMRAEPHAVDGDFDGGFGANYSPPARTRIWSDHVKSGDGE